MDSSMESDALPSDVGAEISTTHGVTPEIYTSWVVRHGEEGAQRLVAAEALADAAKAASVPPNTATTYGKGWKVWERFCAEQGFPETEGSRGALVAFVLWMLDRGRKTPGPGGVLGYAPTSANAHLTAVVVGLRELGHEVSKDAHSEARARLESTATELAKKGDRRGRGQAPAAELDDLARIAGTYDGSPTSARDIALVLTGFYFAARASEAAGLLLADITVHPRGMKVAVVSGKTKRSVRTVAVPYNNDDPSLCAVRAWLRWLDAYGVADPKAPAFPQIDRWGHVGGAMTPESLTLVISRLAGRAGVPIQWTGHSLRSGFATESRKNGKDALQIAKQGGWAPNSTAMLGYMRLADEWDDNAAAGLRRSTT